MERRGDPDRRRHPRGGRRPEDRGGFSPLIMVVDNDARRLALSEAILAKLRFAVAPVESITRAIAIVSGLRPAAIVCQATDVAELRSAIPDNLPIIAVAGDSTAIDSVLQAVVSALRATV